MSRNEIDIVCLNIETIFTSAIRMFVPEIKIQHGKVDLSAKSIKLIAEK